MEKEMTKCEVIEDCITALGMVELPIVQWKALTTIRNVIGNLGLVLKMIEMEEKREGNNNAKVDNE